MFFINGIMLVIQLRQCLYSNKPVINSFLSSILISQNVPPLIPILFIHNFREVAKIVYPF